MYTLLEQMFQYSSHVTSCGYWPLGGKDPSTRLSDGPVLDCSLLQQETRTELESFQLQSWESGWLLWRITFHTHTVAAPANTTFHKALIHDAEHYSSFGWKQCTLQSWTHPMVALKLWYQSLMVSWLMDISSSLALGKISCKVEEPKVTRSI